LPTCSSFSPDAFPTKLGCARRPAVPPGRPLPFLPVGLFLCVQIIRHQAEVIQVSGDSFQHADHPRPVETNKLSLDICIEPKIHDHVFATLQSLQRSMQRRTASTSLDKRDPTLVSGSGRSASFFGAQPPLDCRSWLNQTGICLASGALRSWWIRLELSPVAPAILRIDRPA
jgi:hypothetical protein